jgi:hypothetical protein
MKMQEAEAAINEVINTTRVTKLADGKRAIFLFSVIAQTMEGAAEG